MVFEMARNLFASSVIQAGQLILYAIETGSKSIICGILFLRAWRVIIRPWPARRDELAYKGILLARLSRVLSTGGYVTACVPRHGVR